MVMAMPALTVLAATPVQSIVTDLVIVKLPIWRGLSTQLISPPALVFDNAPAKLAHGVVLAQVARSLPVPETNVWKDAARAGAADNETISPAAIVSKAMRRIGLPPVVLTSCHP